jgi:hypothetical protein
MKYLNQQATKIFLQLINSGKDKISNNDGFMPVHIERIYEVDNGHIYSLAHYYEQNGDLMADPEVCFFHHTKQGFIFPISFQQDSLGIYDESVLFQDGKITHVHLPKQRDLTAFANQWMRNIKLQQSL